MTSPYNLLVVSEDTGTINGEGVGILTIPVGSTQNNNPLALFVPASPTPTATPTTGAVADPREADVKMTATPTPSPTPIIVGAPAGYDVFASVQDLFGGAPELNSGHSIGVASDISPPFDCQNAQSGAPTANLSPVSCVGNGSIAGEAASPDQNTFIVVSKDNVDLMSTSVVPNGQQGGGSFAICAPADTYTFTHVESQPTGTPVAGASYSTTLATPTTISTASPVITPTPPPCKGICSDFSGSDNGKVCLLCQGTSGIPNPL
jgi:hypothetical protein